MYHYYMCNAQAQQAVFSAAEEAERAAVAVVAVAVF